MGITLKTFAEWLQPGPGFVLAVANGSPAFDFGWQKLIPPNSKTRLVAAIPSALSQPDVNEWKSDISSVEWEVVGDTWINIAHKILRTDPDFTYYRQSWFATADGKWTKQFREHELFAKFTALLATKMDRLFSYNRGFIQGVTQTGGPSNPPPPRLQAEMGRRDDSPEQDPLTEGFFGWVARGANWAARNPVTRRVAIAFIPGPGQLIGPAIAIGLYIHSRRSESIQPAEINEPEGLDFTLDALNQIEMPVFQTDKDLGLLAVEHPTDPLYKFSSIQGAPDFLSSIGTNQYG
jgi:hypothetical protein